MTKKQYCLITLLILPFMPNLTLAFKQNITHKIAQEIALASEAAPAHITEHASFMMFKKGRFELIRQGSNNFTCLVVREPKGRFEPSCLNAEAMQSVFYSYQMLMKMLYAGYSYTDTYKAIDVAFKKGELPDAKDAALVYMMSPNNKTYNPETGEIEYPPAHQMYFYSKLDDSVFSLGEGPPWLWQGFPHMSALIIPTEKKFYAAP